jgi:hypothetical protein
MSKIFTLQEAQHLIPTVKEWLEQAIESKRQVETIDDELRGVSERINMMGGSEINPAAILKQRRTKDAALRALRDVIGQIEASGCLVKDLDRGLVDFPALLGDEEVYLCWKLGEDSIGYWHRVEEGYAGRKPIGDDFGRSSGSERPN